MEKRSAIIRPTPPSDRPRTFTTPADLSLARLRSAIAQAEEAARQEKEHR
jgi:hypothetical protein